MKAILSLMCLAFCAAIAVVAAARLSNDALALLVGLGMGALAAVGGALLSIGVAREINGRKPDPRADYNEQQLPAPRIHIVRGDPWAHHEQQSGWPGSELPYMPWPEEDARLRDTRGNYPELRR